MGLSEFSWRVLTSNIYYFKMNYITMKPPDSHLFNELKKLDKSSCYIIKQSSF